jgi:hypothetical protein
MININKTEYLNIRKTLLCLIVPLLLFLGCNDVSNKPTVVVGNNISPSEVVRLYWKASLEGNIDLVRQLITREPASFYDKCKSRDTDGTANLKEVSAKSSNSSKIEDQNENVSFGKSKNEGVFAEYYDKDSEFSSIYGTSHIINVDRYSIQRLFIENELSFEDESRVNLYYEDPYSGRVLESSVFLKKEAGGWKIFLILYKSSLNLFDNESYGKPKSGC